MSRKNLYLVMTALGISIPYAYFLPWIIEHGLDMPLFFHQLQENRISEFFVADVVVTAVVILAFLFFERKQFSAFWRIPVVALMIFGVSAALPLLLCLREMLRKQLT